MVWSYITSQGGTGNTPYFVLLEPLKISSTSGVNFIPYLITPKVGVFGPSFYISDNFPVALNSSGDSLI